MKYEPKRGRPSKVVDEAEEEKLRIINKSMDTLEAVYDKYICLNGEKWLLANNNDTWNMFIEGERMNEVSRGKNGNVPAEFKAFLERILDVRMFTNYKAAIKVNLRTDEEVDYFIGASKRFGLYIKGSWYGELPDGHFPYTEEALEDKRMTEAILKLKAKFAK